MDSTTAGVKQNITTAPSVNPTRIIVISNDYTVAIYFTVTAIILGVLLIIAMLKCIRAIGKWYTKSPPVLVDKDAYVEALRQTDGMSSIIIREYLSDVKNIRMAKATGELPRPQYDSMEPYSTFKPEKRK